MSERCKEILERTYLFLDGEGLTIEERIEIETHLEDCGPCLESYGVEREVVTVLIARLRGHTPCPPGLKERISGLLEEA
jgi:mycothiol system anti-sigma-R factor